MRVGAREVGMGKIDGIDNKQAQHSTQCLIYDDISHTRESIHFSINICRAINNISTM